MVRYFLRDGVSEGRTAEVMSWPLAEVQAVYRTLGKQKTEAHQRAVRARKTAYDRVYRARNKAAREAIKQRVLEDA